MPKVYNKRRNDAPIDAIYVGRPTLWGNPFEIGVHGTRDEVIDKYEQWLRSKPVLMQKVKERLHGKDLVCWCAPLRCHADVLLKIANQE